MKLIHMQTTIQTTFGVDDGEGNAIAQQPVTVQVSRFAADAFVDAHAAIAQARDQALANSEPEPPALAETNGNRAQRRAITKKPRAKSV